MKQFLAAVFISLATGCASAPASLTPVGIEAFNKTRVIKSLDVLRDVAIDGNKTVPPVISTDVTRKVVTYHRSTLLVINASGIKAMSLVSLDELLKDIPKNQSDILTPYIVLAKTVLTEVVK